MHRLVVLAHFDQQLGLAQDEYRLLRLDVNRAVPVLQGLAVQLQLVLGQGLAFLVLRVVGTKIDCHVVHIYSPVPVAQLQQSGSQVVLVVRRRTVHVRGRLEARCGLSLLLQPLLRPALHIVELRLGRIKLYCNILAFDCVLEFAHLI